MAGCVIITRRFLKITLLTTHSAQWTIFLYEMSYICEECLISAQWMDAEACIFMKSPSPGCRARLACSWCIAIHLCCFSVSTLLEN